MMSENTENSPSLHNLELRFRVNDEVISLTMDANEEDHLFKITKWTEDETRMLLDKYEQYMSKVGQHFAIERTEIRVENRYNTVIKRKKDAVDNNKQSGRSRIEVPYEGELSKISSLDDSIEPEVVGTLHGVRVLKPSIVKKNQSVTPTSSTGSASSSSGSARKSKTVHDTLMEIFLKKEETKERCHLEKLELIRELFGGKKD